MKIVSVDVGVKNCGVIVVDNDQVVLADVLHLTTSSDIVEQIRESAQKITEWRRAHDPFDLLIVE